MLLQIVVQHSKRKQNVQKAIDQGRSPNEDSVHKSADKLPIKVGNVIDCYLEKYRDEEPQIREIVNIPDPLIANGMIQVNWYSGTYAEPWFPCKVKQGSKYELWIEEIPTSCVLCNVTLSRIN